MCELKMQVKKTQDLDSFAVPPQTFSKTHFLGKMVHFEPQQPIFLFQYQTPRKIVNDPPHFGHWCNQSIGCFLFLPSIRQSFNLKQDFGEAFHLRFMVTSLRKTHLLALERHPSLPVSWVEQTVWGFIGMIRMQ